MNLTADQKFVLDKLATEDFQELENYFWDENGIKNGSWIDLLDGDFGAHWMRYAVLNGGPKTLQFLEQYGWSSTTSLYPTNQDNSTNYTLAATVLLEGDLNRIQKLYECGWLKGNETVTQRSQVYAHDFAIFNGPVPVSSWLIDYQSKHIFEKKHLLNKLLGMNALANNLYFSEFMKMDEPMGQRYKIYVEHLISTHAQCSPYHILPEFIKIMGADEPNEMLFNEVFLTLLLSDPNAYDPPMQKIWENVLDVNPQLWFAFAKEFPIEQIERQKIQMLKQRSAKGGLETIQKWMKHVKLNDVDLFDQLCEVAQNLSSFKSRGKYSASEIEQALKHTHLLLEVKQQTPSAVISSQRKM